MMLGRGDEKPLNGAPGRVDDKVREGFMEGSDREIVIFLEDKKRVNCQQSIGYICGTQVEECSNSG